MTKTYLSIIEPLGEDALLLRLEPRIDAGINRRVHALAAAIERDRPAWVREVVPGYASLAVEIAGLGDDEPDRLARATAWLQALEVEPTPDTATAAAIDIPICYGGEHGPDLDAVASHCGLDRQAVVSRHAQATYTVAMLGFAPGFPYLIGLDPQLATPRLDTPRTRVPAGSIGIGGVQTGIYPREGPGGWRLIGRTPWPLFDAARPAPSLLVPGQRLRFVAIDADAFARLSAQRRAVAR